MKRLTTSDFLWSCKLGAQLRVLSYDVPLKFEWTVYEHGYKKEKNTIVNCAKGQCVLYYPKKIDEPVFWTLSEMQLIEQIDNGSLILNGIPSNWHSLKTG